MRSPILRTLGLLGIYPRRKTRADPWHVTTRRLTLEAMEPRLVLACINQAAAHGTAFEPDPNGSVYVFQRSTDLPNKWDRVKILAPMYSVTNPDLVPQDLFGAGVAISGDTVVVGASGDDSNGDGAGAVYVFSRNEGGQNNWGQVGAKLTAEDPDGEQVAGDSFGRAVSISGDTIVVPAHLHNRTDLPGTDEGAAYVFVRTSSGDWVQQAKLIATHSETSASDLFGWSSSISGETLVIGAYTSDVGLTSAKRFRAGAAYVFVRNNNLTPDDPLDDTWEQSARLTAVDADNLLAPTTDGFFGNSVSVSGDTIAISAPGDDTNGTNAGAVYVFRRDGNSSWNRIAKLTASDGMAGDALGDGNRSVSLSGDTITVGAAAAGNTTGSVYVFMDTSASGDWTTYTETKLSASGGMENHFFGGPVSIFGDTVMVGAPGDD